MKFIKLIIMGLALASCNKPEYGNVKDRDWGNWPKTLKFTANLSLDTYENCSEMSSDFLTRRHRQQAYQEQVRKASSSRPSASEASSASESVSEMEDSADNVRDEESLTNNQEAGIDEADFLKRSANHIFVSHGGSVEVIDRETRRLIGTMNLKEVFQVPNWNDKVSNISIFALENRLVLHGPSASGGYALKAYDLSPNSLPLEVWSQEFKGSLIDSRLVDGKIYLVSSTYDQELSDWASGWSNQAPEFENEIYVNQSIPCSQIVKTAYNNYNTQFTSIRSLDITSSIPEVNEINLLGASGEEIYMGPKQIILYTSSNYRNSVVTRLNYDSLSGQISLVGRTELPGLPTQGQWAFKELASGHTAVVTTSGGSLEIEGITLEDHQVGRNHLFILDAEEERLSIVGGAINFGKPREDVRSVRFVNENVYIVTFEKTDPLYSFNLSEPTKPTMEDALEIPGFSTYLHQITPGLMVGIGFDAVEMDGFSLYQGIQLSLYDNSDPSNLSRIDNRIYGTRGSYSDATANHLAFFADSETEIFGFPLVELNHSGFPESPWQTGDRLDFAGAVLLQPNYSNETSQFIEVARLTHSDLIPIHCIDLLSQGRWWEQVSDSYEINRIFREGDSIVTVSRFGIKFHDPLQAYNMTSSIRFQSDCGLVSQY